MAQTIQILRSSSTSAPGTNDLEKGELAWVDHGTGGADGRLYIGDMTSAAAVTRHIGGIGTGAIGGALNTLSDVTYANGDLTISSLDKIVSGALEFDCSGDITLDADGGDVFFSDGGTLYGSMTNNSANLIIKSGSTTALTFSGANITMAGTLGVGTITATSSVSGTSLQSSGIITAIGVGSFAGISCTAALDMNDVNITDVGGIYCDTVSVVAAAVGLQVQFGGNTGTNKITLVDNLAEALTIEEAGNDYMNIVTTNGSESITFGKDVILSGDLTVSGTTTTVNSTVVSIADPVFEIGASGSDDNLDRGIKMKYNSGGAKLAFMGYDDSDGKFVMIADATDSSSVFSGTQGNLKADLTGDVTGDVTGDTSGSSGSCTGTAAIATAITVADTSATSTYVTLVAAATGNKNPLTDAGLTYNAGTGMLTATGFTGPLTGLASSATTAAACTGNSATVTVVDGTDTSSFVAIFDSATGSLAAKTDGGLTYNAGTASLATTTFVGALTGTASGNLTTTSTINGGTF